MAKVLVTGGAGFVAVHCIARTLADGHDVRATLRDLRQANDVRASVRRAGASATDAGRLAFVAADLMSDEGWSEAAAGCDFTLHVASPFPASVPKSDDELVVPAREGTLRVLRTARDAGVRRVVMTSSFAAIGYGWPPRAAPFDERDWTDPNGRGVSAYVKSKTLAERAAWDFVAQAGSPELSVVNPVGVFGPATSPRLSTSVMFVKRMMEGSIPACPKLWFGVVDVRDVADLHVRAMTDPAARGERFLATAGDFLSVRAMADALRRRLGAAARRAPRLVLPDWAVRLAGRFDPAVAQLAAELGHRKNATSDKARKILGWSPRSAEDALAASAESVIDLGLVKS